MKETKWFYPKGDTDNAVETEAWLARQAEQGWLLEEIGMFRWRFRRIPPRKLTFSVALFPGASPLDPEPGQAQQEFQDFCAQGGWTLAASFGPLHYFYTDQPDPVPIETEPMVELAQVHQTKWRNGLKSTLVMVVLDVLLVGMFVATAVRDPIGVFSTPLRLFTGLCWLMATLFLAEELVSYGLWYRRARLAAERGEPLPPQGEGRLKRLYGCIGLLLLVLGVVVLWQAGQGTLLVLLLLGYAGVGVILWQLSKALKREKRAAKENRRLTTVSGAVLTAVLLMAVLLVTAQKGGPEAALGLEEKEDITRPPVVQQLLAQRGEGFRGTLFQESTFLLAKTEGAEEGPQGEELSYTVIQVKAPVLYGPCLNQLRGQYEDRPGHYVYRQTDPAPWGASAAWRLWAAGEAQDTWLLCWEDTLVELTADPALTGRA